MLKRCVGSHSALAIAFAGLCCITTVRAESWPQFRGPRGDGAAPTAGVFQGRERIGLELGWKVPIGSGYSGIAVADGEVVTMFSDGKSDVVALFDAATGQERWRVTMGPTYQGHDGSHSGPVASPALDHDRVIALSAHGRLMAIDRKTGSERWSVDVKAEFGAPQPFYGFGTSPTLVNGVLVVQVGAPDAAVVGCDPATGKTLWKAGTFDPPAEGAMPDGVAYQSPIPASFFKRPAVLTTTNHRLLWIDPQRGDVLFEAPHGGGGMGRGAASMTPVPAGGNKWFLEYKEEASALVELEGPGPDAVTLKQHWEDRSIHNSYNIPVYHDGHVYAFSSRFLTCVDAATGKSRWRSRAPGDGFTLLVDGHVVVATKDGGVYVVRATPQAYDEVAGLAVFDDLAWTPPVFADGALFVRSLGELARVNVVSSATRVAQQDAGVAPRASRLGQFLQHLGRAEDKKAAVDQFVEGLSSWPLVEGEWVHFLYRGPGTDLAVAGDLFGARQERPMHPVPGTDLFYRSTRVEPDMRANYLFVRDFEEIVDPRNPRKTTAVLLTREMEFNMGGPGLEMSWFSMPKWQPPAFLEGTVAARGRLEPRTLQSAALGDQEHTIQVYLPAGYDEGQRRYPVVYVQGGKAARELGDWPRALDGLIGSRVKPLITVFIDVESRGGPQYAQMIVQELVPYVDGQFRTVASRDGRAIVGAGFGAFGAIVQALTFPDTFGQGAAQSAVVMDFMRPPLDKALAELGESRPKLYLQWGRYELRNPHEAWDVGEGNQKLVEELKGRGVPVRAEVVPDGTDWAAWRSHTDLLLEALFAL